MLEWGKDRLFGGWSAGPCFEEAVVRLLPSCGNRAWDSPFTTNVSAMWGAEARNRSCRGVAHPDLGDASLLRGSGAQKKPIGMIAMSADPYKCA